MFLLPQIIVDKVMLPFGHCYQILNYTSPLYLGSNDPLKIYLTGEIIQLTWKIPYLDIFHIVNQSLYS